MCHIRSNSLRLTNACNSPMLSLNMPTNRRKKGNFRLTGALSTYVFNDRGGTLIEKDHIYAKLE